MNPVGLLQLTNVIEGDAWSGPGASAMRTVTLTFEDRRRSRLLVRLDDGTEAALMLPRGTVLRAGDCLASAERGVMVQVRAAIETLSVARAADALLLSRGAYHLGNRHVPLQIGPGWLAYEHDHVLDDLARAVGLQVTTESAPFEPEAGGYRHQGTQHHHGEHESPHAPNHEHKHAHANAHAQDHAHAHASEHASEHESEHPSEHENEHDQTRDEGHRHHS